MPPLSLGRGGRPVGRKRKAVRPHSGRQTAGEGPFHRRSSPASSFGCSAAIIVGVPVKDLWRHGSRRCMARRSRVAALSSAIPLSSLPLLFRVLPRLASSTQRFFFFCPRCRGLGNARGRGAPWRSNGGESASLAPFPNFEYRFHKNVVANNSPLCICAAACV